jgi:hypothetical protein
MENEKEITKLVNVLRQIRRTGRFAAWSAEDSESSEFCLQQYNKIVIRLSELEPAIKTLFTPLPEKTSSKTLRFAVSELISYLTDEEEGEKIHHEWCQRREKRRRCGRRFWSFGFHPWAGRF